MAKTTPKKKAWKACSLYIRQRDAMEFSKQTGADPSFGKCCSCGKIIQWKYNDAGHFISKGLGGSSGVYFDSRNIHLQCKTCNAFRQGNAQGYTEFMLKKYGQEVIDELELKDKLPGDKNYWAIEQAYKQKLQELKGGE